MNKVDMSIIRTFIEDELYDLSRADKDKIDNAVSDENIREQMLEKSKKK